MRLPESRNSVAYAFAAAFILGFTVRLIPEVLASSTPIGFDTIYYAVIMEQGVVFPHWTSFFSSTWLLYAIEVPLHSLFGVDPFLLLKVLASALFGLNVAGIYWLAKQMLGWDTRMSLLAGGFFALQVASLRISWDLLRNTLGLGLLLFTLPLIYRLNSKRGLAGFVLLSLLTVFAHEYAAVTLAAIIFGLVVYRLVKKQNVANLKRLLLASSPALAVFLVGLYFRLYPIRYALANNIIYAGDSASGNAGVFFLVNYLGINTPVDFYGSYFNLAFSVTVLFSLLYLSYLLLVWKGFFKHQVLNVWTVLLLAGSFSCLIIPFAALEYWHRWMFMLAYPFTFYAVKGIINLSRKTDIHKLRSTIKVTGRVFATVSLTVAIAAVYLATPILMNTVNIGVFSIYPAYKYFSSTPTVPYSDVSATMDTLKWLDINMENNSCVVLHHAFLEWGRLILNQSHIIVYFKNNAAAALNVAFNNGYQDVYFVWWNQNIGWYNTTVPESFDRLEDFGRISVFEYVR